MIHILEIYREICVFSVLQNDNVVTFSFSKSQENSIDKPDYLLSTYPLHVIHGRNIHRKHDIVSLQNGKRDTVRELKKVYKKRDQKHREREEPQMDDKSLDTRRNC